MQLNLARTKRRAIAGADCQHDVLQSISCLDLTSCRTAL